MSTISKPQGASEDGSVPQAAIEHQGDEIEHWLQTDVADAYDRMREDPTRGIALDEVVKRLRSRRQDGPA